MGEYAEMMLDGTCCHTCGEYLGTDNGYPTACESCGGDDEDEDDAIIVDIADVISECIGFIELSFDGRFKGNSKQLLSCYIAGQLKNSTVVDGIIISPALEKQLNNANNQPNNKKFKTK